MSKEIQLGVEISLYPLQEQYVEHIKTFIEHLKSYDGLYVNTTHTSTLISGEYDFVMNVVQYELKRVYENVGQAIFVCKYLNTSHIALDKPAL